MDLSSAMAFVAARRQGVLATAGGRGHPHLTNILYSVTGDGTIEISVTGDRVKTRNLRREPRCSLYVVGESFWEFAVVEALSELTDVAQAPDDQVVDQLVALYRRLGGEHPDWDDYRRAMVAEGRLVARLRPLRAYGQVS